LVPNLSSTPPSPLPHDCRHPIKGAGKWERGEERAHGQPRPPPSSHVAYSPCAVLISLPPLGGLQDVTITYRYTTGEGPRPPPVSLRYTVQALSECNASPRSVIKTRAGDTHSFYTSERK
ncbi:unnamed protein product, partial [Ectocarpus sp. 8 AP-2014]